MSRIGKQPVALPDGVTAKMSGQTIEVKGPKDAKSFTFSDDVTIAIEDAQIRVSPRGASKRARQQWGMTRTVIANLVHGATNTFKQEMEIRGVGYRAQMQGNSVKLNLGLSHDVEFPIPDGVTVTVPKPTEVVIEGTDKQLVGQVAANMRDWRPPEPYKGKGIRYKGEYLLLKEGKKK
ncbi:50S ribosomal protein L6 [Roseovarius sp. D22-M7]|uniref:50S ribosomal protein L6 n=1 Tax=Roseovarius sp. D22-M7 TaxID=3127116 RepID=UPI00300FA5BB